MKKMILKYLSILSVLFLKMNKFYVIVLAISLSSCDKDENIGCTDPDAVNYDPSATAIPESDIANCIYDTACPSIIQNVNANDYPMDSYSIDTTFINHHTAFIDISYSGGCELHNFELIHEFIFCGTPPVHIQLILSHNKNNETCEALMEQSLCFDISSLYNSCDSSSLFLSLFDPENNNSINFY
jgi:hypothetical protein